MRSRWTSGGFIIVFEGRDRLANIESIEKSAMVDGDSVLGTVHEAEGG